MFCLILLGNNKFIHQIGACHEVKLDLVKDTLPLLTVNELTMKYVLSIIPKAPNRLDLDTNWYFNLETQFCKTLCVCIYKYFVILQNSHLHIYLLYFSLLLLFLFIFSFSHFSFLINSSCKILLLCLLYVQVEFQILKCSYFQ